MFARRRTTSGTTCELVIINYCMCLKINVFVRILRQKQYEEEREKEFQEALDREAVRNIYLSVHPIYLSVYR